MSTRVTAMAVRCSNRRLLLHLYVRKIKLPRLRPCNINSLSNRPISHKQINQAVLKIQLFYFDVRICVNQARGALTSLENAYIYWSKTEISLTLEVVDRKNFTTQVHYLKKENQIVRNCFVFSTTQMRSQGIWQYFTSKLLYLTYKTVISLVNYLHEYLVFTW